MPDITMCLSESCPVRDTCYRKQAKPDKYQSYSIFDYTCNEDNGFCEYIRVYKEEH